MKNITFTYLLFVFANIYCQTVLAQNDSLGKVTLATKLDTIKSSNHKTESTNLISKKDSISINDTVFKIKNKCIYNPERDPKRLAYNTLIFASVAVASFGVLWVAPESVSKWDKEKIKEKGFLYKWKENVKVGPVVDQDNFFFNYVTHPYAGAIYYMSARGSGFKKWESFTYSVLMSAFFWEYGIESFAEISSWQDLFVTPIIGSVIGESFFVVKGNIIRNDKKVLNSKILGYTSLFIIDPFNEIIDSFGYKTKNKIQTYSSIAPIGFNYATHTPIWGLQVQISF